MALEKEEYLWRMVNEHMTQARHQETLRSSMTTLLVTLSVATVGFVTFDKELSLTDLAPSFLLLFLGIFGIFFSAKHYERFNFHIARVRSYRDALEGCFPDVHLRDASLMYNGRNCGRMQTSTMIHDFHISSSRDSIGFGLFYTELTPSLA
jgi:hypothetical protein